MRVIQCGNNATSVCRARGAIQLLAVAGFHNASQQKTVSWYVLEYSEQAEEMVKGTDDLTEGNDEEY
ncbi:hypothetical protein PO909_022392 [Leuciscus waleckii]